MYECTSIIPKCHVILLSRRYIFLSTFELSSGAQAGDPFWLSDLDRFDVIIRKSNHWSCFNHRGDCWNQTFNCRYPYVFSYNVRLGWIETSKCNSNSKPEVNRSQCILLSFPQDISSHMFIFYTDCCCSFVAKGMISGKAK